MDLDTSRVVVLAAVHTGEPRNDLTREMSTVGSVLLRSFGRLYKRGKSTSLFVGGFLAPVHFMT